MGICVIAPTWDDLNVAPFGCVISSTSGGKRSWRPFSASGVCSGAVPFMLNAAKASDGGFLVALEMTWGWTAGFPPLAGEMSEGQRGRSAAT